MRAITLLAEDIALIEIGAKRYLTTQGYFSGVGDQIALHSHLYGPLVALDNRFWELLDANGINGPFARQALVATCYVTACDRIDERFRSNLPESELVLGDYRDGRFALTLGHTVPLFAALPCVPPPDAYSWWEVPEDYLEYLNPKEAERSRKAKRR